MTALAFQAQVDVPGATAFDPQEPFIVLAYLIAVVLLMVNLPAGPALQPAGNEKIRPGIS
ncbi:hypothetical protein [Catelliglobosispora koreensis]|uniref:hypothetical protein n=1 Tax=Catelliglobosispora koreensis TaxID=129052 RepID=UPI00035F180B|nr:hypothetical protein [Catelliglobosispora koreensis]